MGRTLSFSPRETPLIQHECGAACRGKPPLLSRGQEGGYPRYSPRPWGPLLPKDGPYSASLLYVRALRMAGPPHYLGSAQVLVVRPLSWVTWAGWTWMTPLVVMSTRVATSGRHSRGLGALVDWCTSLEGVQPLEHLKASGVTLMCRGCEAPFIAGPLHIRCSSGGGGGHSSDLSRLPPRPHWSQAPRCRPSASSLLLSWSLSLSTMAVPRPHPLICGGPGGQ